MNRNLYSLLGLVKTAVLAAALTPSTAQAQHVGFSNSNYAGTHSLYTNPASIADARHAFYLNLFSVEAGFINNYLRYDAPVSFFKLVKDDLDLKDEYLKENVNGKEKFGTAVTDFRGPSFMLRLSPKHSIGFTSRVRGAFQIDNASEEFARMYKVSGGEADEVRDKKYINHAMNFNSNLYSELGLSYARVLYQKDAHFLKGGVTIKKLAGAYSAYFLAKDTDYIIRERPVAGSNDTDDIVMFDKVTAKYGYVSEDALEDLEASNFIKLLTASNTPGKGWGADLGLTYEFRPNQDSYQLTMDGVQVYDEEKNKYKYRVGISLMDLGGITYDKAGFVRAYDVKKTNKEVNLSDFDDAEETEDYFEVINNSLDVTEDEKKTSFRSGLPTALNLNVDYHVKGHFYVNATVIQDLRGKEAISMKQNSLLALTPRLEYRKFELAIPLALQHDYTVPTLGAMLRLGDFFIGSDNIVGVFNIGQTYGANVYAGIALLPILQRNKKDQDGDGISDKNDKCKTVPGTSETMGCPN